jgi:two-component system alkaline phosphatase synthesis response regulator PhoP
VTAIEHHTSAAGPEGAVMERVLIIEDDEAMAFALRDGFEYEGYSVLVASEGDSGLRLASEKDLSLIVLDVMLPNVSGIDVCKRIRGEGNDVPIIMLTARGQEIDKVLGLKSGADDYITKPFSFLELMARVEALLRRTSKSNKQVEQYEFDGVAIDFKKLEATKDGEPLELSPLEYKIMKFLIDHRDQVVTRDQMLDAVWDYRSFPFTRTVDMHIAKLRKKIERTPNNPRHIVTVHGAGYKFIG